MPQGKKSIADSCYKYLNEHIAIHRGKHSKEITNHINCVRACHEDIYSRLKVFDILSDNFVVAGKSMTSIKCFLKDA